MTATNDVLRSRELRLELIVLFASVCMSGCDLMTAGFMPAVDKINAAFPIAQELQLARGRLVATLESDKPAQQRFVEQFNQMLEIRALTCRAQSPIGRMGDGVSRGRASQRARTQELSGKVCDLAGA